MPRDWIPLLAVAKLPLIGRTRHRKLRGTPFYSLSQPSSKNGVFMKSFPLRGPLLCLSLAALPVAVKTNRPHRRRRRSRSSRCERRMCRSRGNWSAGLSPYYSANVTARVSGLLLKRTYKEGDEVRRDSCCSRSTRRSTRRSSTATWLCSRKTRPPMSTTTSQPSAIASCCRSARCRNRPSTIPTPRNAALPRR